MALVGIELVMLVSEPDARTTHCALFLQTDTTLFDASKYLDLKKNLSCYKVFVANFSNLNF